MRGQRQSAISLTIDGFETRDNIDDLPYTRFNPDELDEGELRMFFMFVERQLWNYENSVSA